MFASPPLGGKRRFGTGDLSVLAVVEGSFWSGPSDATRKELRGQALRMLKALIFRRQHLWSLLGSLLVHTWRESDMPAGPGGGGKTFPRSVLPKQGDSVPGRLSVAFDKPL